jgi:hypothetical protein
MNRDWSRPGVEPGLEEALADPVVLLVLRRDGLTAADVRAVIARLRRPWGLATATPRLPHLRPCNP